jgi:hypothetical protein
MAKKLTRTEKMRRYMVANPEQTVAQVATEFGVPYQTAYMAKRTMDRAVNKVVNKVIEEKVRRIEAADALAAHQATDEPEPTGIDATLAERGTKYGRFADHAAVTYKLKNILREHSGTHGKSYAYDQAEALDMICHKLGRIVNGDPDYADSWVDIAGYAKLVADRLQTGKRV